MTSYANDLWNKVDFVLSQSIERRKQIEDFIYAINKRVEAEESYAKNIQAVGCMMDKYIAKNTAASFTYSAFKSDHIHRAEQARVFVTSLKDQVIIMLKELQQTQNAEWRKIEKQTKKLQKQMQEHSQKMSSSKAKLEVMEKQWQQQLITVQIMKVSCDNTIEKKQKQLVKAKESQKQFKDFQFTYKNITKQYNQFLLVYYNEIAQILGTLEQHQENRLEKQVDTIMKILVFQTAMMRNFDYDISNISQQMQNINARSDIESFIKEHSDGVPKLKPQLVNMEEALLAIVITKIGNKQFQTRLAFEKNENVRMFIESHLKTGNTQEEIKGFDAQQKKDFAAIVELVGACWKNKPIPIQMIHGGFKQLMDKDLNRFFFQLAFRFYGSHFSLQLMQNGFISASRLFQTVIEKSLQKKDVFTIRKLLNLIFSQWTMDPPRPSQQQLQRIQTMSMMEEAHPVKSKRKQLYTVLTHLAVWRNQDFWEGVILQSIQQQLMGLSQQKGQTAAETKAKQKNVVLSQLASYSHIMIMLGTTPKNVRLSIGRYSRLYGLSEQQNKDLSKTISETWKVYKDLIGKEGKNVIQMKKKQERVSSDFRAMML